MSRRARRRIRRKVRRKMGLDTSGETRSGSGSGGPLTTGLILLGLGAVFLAERLGVAVLDPERLWPLIMMIVGMSLLISAPLSRAADKVLPGMINLQLGAFFLLFTAGPLDFSQLNALWPMFPLLVGISFCATFVASLGTKPQLLVPGFVCFSVGVIGLAFTLTPLGGVLAFFGWPVILLSLGALFMLGGLARLLVRSLAFVVRA